jgi:hypothetical protein
MKGQTVRSLDTLGRGEAPPLINASSSAAMTPRSQAAARKRRRGHR